MSQKKKSSRKTIVLDRELELFIFWYQNYEIKNSSEFIRNLIRNSREYDLFIKKGGYQAFKQAYEEFKRL